MFFFSIEIAALQRKYWVKSADWKYSDYCQHDVELSLRPKQDRKV